MGKKLTTDEFIEIAKSKHQLNNTPIYEYSLTDYKTAHVPVIIQCAIHGEFSMTPANHTHKSKPQGCPQCGLAKQVIARTHTMDDFITRAQKIHSIDGTPSYSYDHVHYVNARTKVTICCPVHGEFVQIPSHHLKGHGCSQCANEYRKKIRSLTTHQFKDKAILVHGHQYNYDESIYSGNNRTKITVICPEHGKFTQMAGNHLRGHGCPVCGEHMSKAETEICHFLDKLQVTYTRNDRTILKPKELDIVIPNHHVAIEYCGNYWHSELHGKNRKYHLEKYQQAAVAGYRLLTIFEDEWVTQNSIVISRIKKYS